MSIAVPSKKSVAKAGDVLRSADPSSQEYAQALNVLAAWRSLYAYPLNAFNVLLRSNCVALGLQKGNYIVARRLKRAPSIVAKLKRFAGMNLSRMQDIGGLRVILNSVDEVRALHSRLMSSQMGHAPVEPFHDYILEPKDDGYRSIHQVFRYRSEAHDELTSLGLKIEVQIRTRIQHSWATAVEALGVIEKSAFKSGEGENDFKRFFILSSALVSILEGQPLIKELRDSSPLEIVKEFEDLQDKLSVFLKLESIVVSVDQMGARNSGYCVMELDASTRKLSLWNFRSNQVEMAETFYKFRELENRTNDEIEVVLVSVNSLRQVQRAYPNYFLDCKDFIENLKEVCQRIKKQ